MTVAGVQDTAGTLVLNGPTTITNGDNNTPPIGLQVSNDATILGSGSLTLGQTTPTPFNYDSTSTASAFTGPIGGLGGVEVTNSGTLALSNSSSNYTGGTDLDNGTLNIDSTYAIGGPTATLTFNSNPILSILPVLQAGDSFTLSNKIVVDYQSTTPPSCMATFDTNSYTMTLLSPIVGDSGTAIPSLSVIDSSGTNDGKFVIAASETLDEVTVGINTVTKGVSGGTLDVGPGGMLNLVASGTGLDDNLGAGLNISNGVLSDASTINAVAGTINLGTDTALRYESGETSEFDGPITGPGQLDVDQGTLIVGSALNDYSGGTNVAPNYSNNPTSPDDGTLQLKMDTKLDAPAALGGGPVGIGLDGTLDLGCPLTIPSIATLGTPGTASTNGTIKDTSTSNAVTVLTIAGGSYAGEIEGSIRLVKIGPGELDLGEPTTNSTFTGTELDGGEIVLADGGSSTNDYENSKVAGTLRVPSAHCARHNGNARTTAPRQIRCVRAVLPVTGGRHTECACYFGGPRLQNTRRQRDLLLAA